MLRGRTIMGPRDEDAGSFGSVITDMITRSSLTGAAPVGGRNT